MSSKDDRRDILGLLSLVKRMLAAVVGSWNILSVIPESSHSKCDYPGRPCWRGHREMLPVPGEKTSQPFPPWCQICEWNSFGLSRPVHLSVKYWQKTTFVALGNKFTKNSVSQALMPSSWLTNHGTLLEHSEVNTVSTTWNNFYLSWIFWPIHQFPSMPGIKSLLSS